jgi:hypothetical protein
MVYLIYIFLNLFYVYGYNLRNYHHNPASNIYTHGCFRHASYCHTNINPLNDYINEDDNYDRNTDPLNLHINEDDNYDKEISSNKKDDNNENIDENIINSNRTIGSNFKDISINDNNPDDRKYTENDNYNDSADINYRYVDVHICTYLMRCDRTCDYHLMICDQKNILMIFYLYRLSIHIIFFLSTIYTLTGMLRKYVMMVPILQASNIRYIDLYVFVYIYIYIYMY